jgi:hypothetical protein
MWVVVGLTVLAFALRVYRLDASALRGDESFTVLFVTQPLAQMWEGIRNIEPNPPLYYLLLRGALWLWGASDWAARYVSAWFGVLAVPLIYRLGRDLLAGPLGSRQAGGEVEARRRPFWREWAPLLAALLLAVNPYQVWHSQDVRNYTVWPALSLVSLCFLVKALRQPADRPWLWVGYVLTSLLSLYTHYYDAFSLLFQNAFVLLFYWRQGPVLRRWFASQAILALLFLPWLLLGSSRPLTYQAETAGVPGLPGMAARSLSVFGLGETIPQGLAAALLPALALLVILGLAAALGRGRRIAGFLGLYIGIPILCIWLLAQWRPVFHERYLNVIAPGLYLAFALALTGLASPALRAHRPAFPTPSAVGAGASAGGASGRRWGAGLAAAAALLLLLVPAAMSLGNHYFNAAYAKSGDWRVLAAYLSERAGAGDAIIQNYPDPGLAHYYHGPAARLVMPDRSAVDQVGDLEVDRLGTGRALARLLERYQRVWLLPFRSPWDPDGFVEAWLERRARKVDEAQVDIFRVVAYERDQATAPTIAYPLQVQLGEEVQLLGYDLEAGGGCQVREAEDGGLHLSISDHGACLLDLTLYWQALALMDEDYTVFTHLTGAEGRVWAQHDGQPQAGSFPTREWFPRDVIVDEHRLQFPSDGTPPGPYRLEVGMYLLASNTRLAARGAAGEPWPQDAMPLPVSIEVSPGP